MIGEIVWNENFLHVMFSHHDKTFSKGDVTQTSLALVCVDEVEQDMVLLICPSTFHHFALLVSADYAILLVVYLNFPSCE